MIGTAAAATTRPSGQYMFSSTPVTTVSWVTLMIRNSSPKPLNRRIADRSVQQEIHVVGVLLTSMLTRAMHPDHDDITDEDVAVARVIGDVWLSSLVAWVTGRSTAAEATEHLERAIRMLLR